MRLEDQVCSLELAQKLKDLGVEQESVWYWQKYNKEWLLELITNLDLTPYYSAFTVAELGDMINSYGNLELPYYANKVWRSFMSKIKGEESTEANARAKMLIWLSSVEKVKL